MSYEAWRISYQSSEQAARAAWNELQAVIYEMDQCMCTAAAEADELDRLKRVVTQYRNALTSALKEEV